MARIALTITTPSKIHNSDLFSKQFSENLAEVEKQG